jgi:hypothetical protein
MISSESLTKFEKTKDINGLLGSFEIFGQNRKEAINKLFYLWYIVLEPDFRISLNRQSKDQLTNEIKINFNYCNVEFGLDAYYNATIGYIAELTSWYFFDKEIPSDTADALGKKMKERSLLIDNQNPIALLVSKRELTQSDKNSINLFFEEIATDTNSIFFRGTIPAEYFAMIYSERRKRDNF